MERLIKAWENSVRAFRRLSQTETAFQQELVLLAFAIPAAWFLSTSWRGYWLLVGAILLLIMVEVLNTGIEATCDDLLLNARQLAALFLGPQTRFNHLQQMFLGDRIGWADDAERLGTDLAAYDPAAEGDET